MSFTCRSRFSADSKRSPSGAATAITAPSTSDSPDRRGSPASVEREERRRATPRACRRRTLPRLARRDRRRQLVPAEQPPAEVGGRVVGEDGEQHGERRRAGRAPGSLAEQQQMRRGRAPIQADAEDRRRDRDGRRLPRLGEAVEQERERRASSMKPPTIHAGAAELRRRAASRARRRSRRARAAAAAAPSRRTRAARPAPRRATSPKSHQPPR